MKKSELISGLHVLEVKNGEKYFVCGDYLQCNVYGWGLLSEYQEDLTFDNDDYSVVKIYKVKEYLLFNHLMKDENLELVWERKELPKLEEYENTIISCVNTKFGWIARDKPDEGEKYGSLYLFQKEPKQNSCGEFCSDSKIESFDAFIHIFQSITHENSPLKINDLLF